MTRKALHLSKLCLAMLLSLPSLPAQQASETGPTDQSASFTPGVSVDAAHKSSDLATAVDTEKNKGETGMGFEVKQSVEFGGRISDFTGSQGMWSSLINLGTGPRLLEYTLAMHSPTHTGVLFDDLTFSNFGYGGDPNNVSRFRIQ